MIPEIIGHYTESGLEKERLLSTATGMLELARTVDILDRFLPPPPASILDVGGGPGLYSCLLAERGYSVNLIDITPLHVEQARSLFRERGVSDRAVAAVGDGRELALADESVDVVLFMGPLYHLQMKGDRMACLAEALRVLKKGGIAFVSAISRFASLHDGLLQGYIDDPRFESIVKEDLRSGMHENPTERFEYHTNAYFHHPAELDREIAEAGFRDRAVLGVEGPAWLLADLETRIRDDKKREQLLNLLRVVERETSLLGVSAHLFGMGKK